MATSITHFNNKRLKVFLSLFLVVLLTLPPIANMIISKVSAGALTNYKVLINNSQSSATNTTYTMQWTTANATAIKQIDVSICTTASGACVAPGGFSTGTPTLASDNISGTGRTVAGSTANNFRIVVTTPAAQTPSTMTMTWTGVTNPSTTNSTYYARATSYSDTGTTAIDNGTAAFAILTATSIAVTATVDPSFSFSVVGVAGDGVAAVNGATLTNGLTTTATTIPFGSLAVGTPKIAAHDLTISSNAANGYQITASHSANLAVANAPLASGSADIDAFSGTNASPATWTAPAGTSANTNTGYFGYTTNDASLCIGTAARFTASGGNKWAGSSTTGQEVACSASTVTNETTRVGWELEVNAVQPPGLYSGTVIFVATPTY
jgi:hypothetical protein